MDNIQSRRRLAGCCSCIGPNGLEDKKGLTGLVSTFSAYFLWGILPLYWKAISIVPAQEIICHRILWSLLVTFLLLSCTGRWRRLLPSLHRPKILIRLTLTSALLGTNWLIYVWSVNAGYVIESSLGYFINPLLAVLLGVVFLKERLRIGQWAALLVALSGVLYLTVSYGHLPWIGLSLAMTFALYSLLRKTASLDSLEGLFLEMALLSIPCMVALAAFARQGTSHFLTLGPTTTLLLAGTGLITSLPLLLFVFGAQRITMTLVGLLQYIAPTLQFLIGLLIYNESFPLERGIGFSIIWAALILYSGETLYMNRRQRRRILSAPDTSGPL